MAGALDTLNPDSSQMIPSADAPSPDVPGATGSSSAGGGLSAIDPNSTDAKQFLSQFVDPDAKWRNFSAAALSTRPGAGFAAGLGSGLSALSASTEKQNDLTAQYLPKIQQMLIARQNQARSQDIMYQNAALGAVAPLLNQQGPITSDMAQSALANAVTTGRVPAAYAQRLAQTLSDDPDTLRQQLTGQVQAATDPFNQHPIKLASGQSAYNAQGQAIAQNKDYKVQSVQQGDQVTMLAVNQSDPSDFRVLGSYPVGASPDAQLQAKAANYGHSVEAENNQRDNKTKLTLAGMDEHGQPLPGSASILSDAAVENAAARYNVDGTLPPMGMGTAGNINRDKILNRAAQLTLGKDPSQIRANQLDAHAAASALTQLTKAQAMNQAFEDTANQNAEMAIGLSKQNDRTGVPIVNAALQAIRTGTGSPEASQFNAANETFVNEYAKVMSGSMGGAPVSDAASNRAHKMLNTAMANGQYEATVRLLQREMANRMKGFDEQGNALRARIGGAPSPAGSPSVDPNSIVGQNGSTLASFGSEADAKAAAAAGKIKTGDRITVNGQTGTWH